MLSTLSYPLIKMLRLGIAVAVYFTVFISPIVVYCQSVDYTLQKISSESRPNEQPLLLLGRKESHLAIPQFSNGIPQIEFNYNEEFVLSCPEKSDPGEIVSAVSSLEEAPNSAENVSGQATATGEEGRIGHTSILSIPGGHVDSAARNADAYHNGNFGTIAEAAEDQSTTERIVTVKSSSTFDSVPSTSAASLLRMPEIAETSNREVVVQETVTKKKAKFFATDIKFPWELPYLKCEQPAQAFVRKVLNRTRGKRYEIQTCEDNGQKFEVGFWVKSHKSFTSSVADVFRFGKKRKTHKKAYEWHPLITVCFNMREWRPVYTKYTLYGSAIKAAAKLMLRPNNFDYEERFQPYDRVDPSQFYDKFKQYKLFVDILGVNIAFTYNDTVSKFLIPLQLVDPAEMPTPVSTLTTYSYMTTTPSWEGVALRNWRILTKTVMSYADEKQLKLAMYSGTAHILQLQTAKGELKDIHLKDADKTLAVAKILFKLVHNELSNEVIVFFVHNNPYVIDSSYKICLDVCESAGWYNELWRNLDRGYITCCDYEEVRNTYISLPKLAIENIRLLENHQPQTEPVLSEMNEMTEPLNSEAAFSGAIDVGNQPGTSIFRRSSAAPEIGPAAV